MSVMRGVVANTVSRRSFLGGAAGWIGAAMLGGRRAVAAEGPAVGGFRFAHMTDIHLQPELHAGEGFRKALKVAHEMKPRPDFILTGGDLVFDTLNQSESRAKTLFDLFTSVCRDSDIPFRHCLGNHDAFGWGSKGKIPPTHPQYGKKMATERLGLDKPTYSFDHKGWHFCVVDDVVAKGAPGQGYEGGFTEDVLDWLNGDLAAAANRPKIVCAHIPVVSIAAFRDVDATTQPVTAPARSRTCRNPKAILKLFREHNVGLSIAGHLHDNETLRFERTTFITDGAVSGSWWKGPHNLSPEGFGVIDVRSDGTFEHRYHEYGWKAG